MPRRLNETILALTVVALVATFATPPVQAAQGSKACPKGGITASSSLFEQYKCGYPSGRPGGR